MLHYLGGQALAALHTVAPQPVEMQICKAIIEECTHYT